MGKIDQQKNTTKRFLVIIKSGFGYNGKLNIRQATSHFSEKQILNSLTKHLQNHWKNKQETLIQCDMGNWGKAIHLIVRNISLILNTLSLWVKNDVKCLWIDVQRAEIRIFV